MKYLLLFDFSNNLENTKYKLNTTNKLWKAKKKKIDLPIFSFTNVSAPTNNFFIETKLGKGNFEPIYTIRLTSMAIIPLRVKRFVS